MVLYYNNRLFRNYFLRLFMSFISNAFADGTHSVVSGANSLISFLPMVIIFALFWLLLIRPQQKKMKLHNQMLSSLEKGAQVLTNSGIVGKIIKLSEEFIELEVANGVVMTFQRSSIAGKLNKDIAEKTKI